MIFFISNNNNILYENLKYMQELLKKLLGLPFKILHFNETFINYL